ncbi:hypothetical protein DL96DRAFT_1686383 [Flagelloscypha sp. PMI_526]|nr:hypothetical protein DL96DRAFT_1686383 [Flagelloscypha sp. PMI_526]
MQSCALLDLPHDLLVELFCVATTFSRISLRQTCRTLYSMSKERALWIQCLNHLIQTTRLYSPSFPLDDMTNDQLEAAANMPLRFRCNLANGRTSSTPPRYLNIDQSITRYNFRNIVLVPGGRYLVTLNKKIVRLWDIGVVACERVPDRLVTEVDCGIGLSESAQMDADFNGIELYIRVAAARTVGVWCAIYRINPLDESPKFTLLGLLDTNLFTPFSFHFDPYEMVVVYSTAIENGGNMWIWDLSTNSLATWPGGGQSVNRIYITEGHALLISRPQSNQLMLQGDIHVLPKVPQSSSHRHPQQLPSPFVHSITWEDDFPNFTSQDGSIASPEWWEARKSQFPFELICRRQTDASDPDSVYCEIVHKVLQKSISEPSRFEAVTRHRGRYEGNMFIPPNILSIAILLPDDVRIMYWLARRNLPPVDDSNFQHLYVHVTSLAEKKEYESNGIDMCLPLWTHWNDQHMFWRWFGFSPAMGRYCCVDGGNVFIYDYGE